MAGILDSVDQRTGMVGKNRLELLLFRLGSRQRYGINVFKVLEVMHRPTLRPVPGTPLAVRGFAHVRGRTFPAIDLRRALRMPDGDSPPDYLVITEYNRSIQGFLVGGIDRIIHMSWAQIQPPPPECGNDGYVTAVTYYDEELIEIIDVERVLSDFTTVSTEVDASLIGQWGGLDQAVRVLAVDDSGIARTQIAHTLRQVGIEPIMLNNGREALDWLRAWADAGCPEDQRPALVISDIEMPVMDGYTLTHEIKRDPRLKDLHVLLHSSLSGVFNDAMVRKVGADAFLAKFCASTLAEAVLSRLQAIVLERLAQAPAAMR